MSSNQEQTSLKKNSMQQSTKTSSNQKMATIGKSIFINGTVQGEEDLTIEGQVEGSIQMQEANVVIASTGKIVADIVAKTIIVEGSVRGELRGTESVEIKPNGKLIGDIRSPRVMLSDGCQFKGNVDMEHKPESGQQGGDRGRAGLASPAGGATRLAAKPSLVKPADSAASASGANKGVGTSPSTGLGIKPAAGQRL